MEFEISKEFIASIRQAVEEEDKVYIKETLDELHPADLAEILHEVNMEEAKYIFQQLEDEKAANILLELEEDVRERFLKELTAEELAIQFDNLETDDAADLIASLSEDRKEEVITQLKDAEQASDIVDLLNYEEGTAGALMAKELIKVKENWTVLECVREMRKQAKEVEEVYTVYVIDQHEKLLGRLSLKKLLLSPDRKKIADIYSTDLHSVKARAKLEEVVNVIKKYDLVALPVIDELGRLLGRITVDDVVDVMEEEAEKDYQMASGISDNVDDRDSVFTLTKARLPWLLVGLLGGAFGATVIEMFEGELAKNAKLAFFIPLIAAMGGNVGVQSSAIVVQGLANNSLKNLRLFKRLGKELMVALVNGAVCATVILLFNMILFRDEMALSITVSVSLIAVILFAASFGTLTPLVLDKYKIDPALATGPFITTVNDVLGLLFYFLIGQLFLN